MKFRWFFVVAAICSFAFVGTDAIAQKGGDSNVTVIKGKDRTLFRKKTVIDFEDSTVEGDLVKPEGSAYTVRGRAKFNSLIRYRPNFVPEMWKAARNL
jgi:hypothetical protein